MIQYLSDLHLEKNNIFNLIPSAPYLILAGDIGYPETQIYQDFIQDCASKYKKVFVVLGNHESYHKTWDETITITQNLFKKYDNVFLLHRNTYDLTPTIRIAGATLWTKIAGVEAYEIMCTIQDYTHIKKLNSVSITNRWHDLDKKWLLEEIQKAEKDNVKLIIVTHHAPYKKNTSHPKYNLDPLSSAFSTDLSKTHFIPPVYAWIYGHTHYSNTQIVNNVILTSNPRGYQNPDFDIGKTISL